MSTTQTALSSFGPDADTDERDATPNDDHDATTPANDLGSIPDAVAAWFATYRADGHHCPNCGSAVARPRLPFHYRDACPGVDRSDPR